MGQWEGLEGLNLYSAFVACVGYSKAMAQVWLPLKSRGTFPDRECHGLDGFVLGGEGRLLNTLSASGHKFRDLPTPLHPTRLQVPEFSGTDLVS